MTNSFLDNGGWTPVPDKLVKEYDYATAYVWGNVWRYCQMEDEVCKASHDTLAERTGMSRRALIDKLNTLIEGGYIEDLTPDLKNRPHTYCVKKGEEKLNSTMQNLHSEPEVTMQNLHSKSAEFAQQNGPTMQNLHSHYAEFAQPTMQNLHTKKLFKESSDISVNGTDAKSESREMFSALANTCKVDLALITSKVRGQFNQAEKKMRDNGYTPKDITDFETWWYQNDWRGQKGQAPDLENIRKEWGKFKTAKTNKVRLSAK